MGTNFYLFSRNKEKVTSWFAWDEYKLTDEPDFGYAIHIAKTSCGWLPLFQAHERIRSVADMKRLVDTGDFSIIDEYGDTYDWNGFSERVLQFNGGIAGAIPPTPYDNKDLPEWMRDPDMPDHTPISHFEYTHGKYTDTLFKDPQGFEFDTLEFC